MISCWVCELELRLTRKKEAGLAISDHEGDVLEQFGLGTGDTYQDYSLRLILLLP